MLEYLGIEMPMLMLAISAAFTFGAVILSLKLFKSKLPVDGGREFAFNGKLSKGKQRGAGIVFICVFIIPPMRPKINGVPLRQKKQVYFLQILHKKVLTNQASAGMITTQLAGANNRLYIYESGDTDEFDLCAGRKGICNSADRNRR